MTNSDGRVVATRIHYDHASKLALYNALTADRRAHRAQGVDSVHQFHNMMSDVIAKAINAGVTFFDPSRGGETNTIDPSDVSEKTIYNLVEGKGPKLTKIHPATFRIVDAYLQARNIIAKPSVYGGSFLGTLGAHVAAQYVPRPDPDLVDDWQVEVLGLFTIDAKDIYIPGSDRNDRIIVSTRRAPPGSQFVHCRVAISSSPDFADIRDESRRSDSRFEDFGGIGMRTTAGLSCHLVALATRAPLYLLIIPPSLHQRPAGLLMSTTSFESPGYISEYAEMTNIEDDELFTYFDNLPWFV